MGFKCVAPGCRTGYSKEDANNVNVSLFKFPDKERSPERRVFVRFKISWFGNQLG